MYWLYLIFGSQSNAFINNLCYLCYIGTVYFTPEDAILTFQDENHDYEKETNSCDAVCGHYTQVYIVFLFVCQSEKSSSSVRKVYKFCLIFQTPL